MVVVSVASIAVTIGARVAGAAVDWYPYPALSIPGGQPGDARRRAAAGRGDLAMSGDASRSSTGLSYWYPGDIPALVDVNLDLEPGLTLVVGPSGGGKSSLLRLFNGLIPHFHGGRIGGTATVFGHDVSRTATRTLARDVGFVFQDPERQVVYGSVEREVAFGLENLGVGRSEMVLRVGAALERLGLVGLRMRRVGTLSGGERQRVAIASVLAMAPRLIVLDEPTSELDASGERGRPRRMPRPRGRAARPS